MITGDFTSKSSQLSPGFLGLAKLDIRNKEFNFIN